MTPHEIDSMPIDKYVELKLIASNFKPAIYESGPETAPNKNPKKYLLSNQTNE